MKKTRSMRRTMVVLTAVAALAAAMLAAPATAATGTTLTFGVDGDAAVPTFPGAGTVDFEGDVVAPGAALDPLSASLHTDTADGTPGANDELFGDDLNYNELTCLTGFADGTVAVGANGSAPDAPNDPVWDDGHATQGDADIQYVRVGNLAAVAVTNATNSHPGISNGVGAGVFEFSADNATFANRCVAPGPLSVHILGQVVIVDAGL